MPFINLYPICPLNCLLGDSEIDELFRIFRLRGTPNDEIWPGVTTLKDWKPKFPQWHRQPLEQTLPSLCAEGVDLLGQMIEYDPARRISAKRGMPKQCFCVCKAVIVGCERKGLRKADRTDLSFYLSLHSFDASIL